MICHGNHGSHVCAVQISEVSANLEEVLGPPPSGIFKESAQPVSTNLEEVLGPPGVLKGSAQAY